MRPAARPAPTHFRKAGPCSCASTDSWARNSADSTRSGRAVLRTGTHQRGTHEGVGAARRGEQQHTRQLALA